MAFNPDELKIAIVHENLTIRGGAEKVLFALHQMFPSATIYTPLCKPELFPELAKATIITAGINRFPFFRNRQQLLTPLMPYLVEQFDLSDYDLVISISMSAAKGALTRPETLHVCYCNTPMRWAWMPYLDPRASGSMIRRWSAHYLRMWDITSVPRVDTWIANSQTIAQRIRKFYKQDAVVIYPPVDMPTREMTDSKGDYFLTVGRLEDQKRVDLLIEATKLTGAQLKIAGSGGLKKALQSQAAGHENIEFLGFVSQDEKERLYQNCKAFLFASEEDFGIVPVEAMSYGKPVIAYGKGGAAETVIDQKTGLLFAEQTPQSLAAAIKDFDNHTFDATKIAVHAQQYSQAEFAQNMHHFLEKAWKEHTA
jgi:glycosyltransferase involved in cell wall biosynthesis